MNIQGLCPQTKPSPVPYLRDILITENHIFLGLTETWLSTDHKEAELEIEGYKLFRKDRNRVKAKHGRYSGGVAFYIRDDIAPLFKPLLEFSNGVNEALLLYSKHLNMMLSIIYRQPTNPQYRSDAPEFEELLSSMISKIETVEGCTPDLYICGDFNIPHTLSNEILQPTTSCNGQLLKIFNDFSLLLNLNQIVQKSTHTNGNILDFLLTNNSDTIFDYKTTHTIHSDHLIVDVITHLTFTKTKKIDAQKNLNNKFDNYNFYSDKINWENINKNFDETNWLDILKPFESDPEKQYDVFLNVCIDVLVANNVPSRKPKKKQTIPRDRRILMRKRKKLKKKIPNNKTTQKLIEIELQLRRSYTNERTNSELNATSKIKTNPKYFYSYVKRFSKTKPKVGPLMDPITNHLTNDSSRMTDILQEQYKSVFTTPKSL